MSLGFVLGLLLFFMPLAEASRWFYHPPVVPDVFTATGSGANAGFCAEAETLQFNTGDWTDITDAAASGGHTLQANVFGSQIAASLGFASDTYYGWIVGRCTQGDRCAVWVQHIDLLPRTPSNTLAMKFPLGGEVAVTPIGARTDEDLRRTLTPSDTVQRSFAITEDQALYIQAQPGVQLDYVFFTTNPNATPSCDDAPAQTVNLVIYHADTLPTPDGTLDAIWTNASQVAYSGFGSATAAWDTRALYKQDASPRRLCLLHQGTLANMEASTSTEDGTGVFSSDTGMRFDFREDVGTTRPLSYSTATNGNATPTTRDGQFSEADAFGPSLDFANRSSGRSYAANLLRIETCFDLPTALVAGQTFRCDLRALEKVTGSAFTYKRAYSTDDTLATAGICQLSTTTVADPPADSTPPTMGAVSFSNVTSNGFTATSAITEAESTISACQVQYDTDNDNAVSGGDASALLSCGLPQGGSCVCPVSGLSAATAYEVVVKATNSAGLIGTSAVADQTTSAAGAQRYLSASGTDSGDCSNSGSPCRTFAYAFNPTRFPAGATLNLANGTYGASTSTGYPQPNCSQTSAYRNGTAAATITLRATNARQAHILGSGAESPLRMTSCNYWNIEDIRWTGVDSTNTNAGPVLSIATSTNINVRRNLIVHGNGLRNVAMVLVRDQSSAVLLEENELYVWCLKAIQFYHSANNIVRGNYGNSRGYKAAGGVECPPSSNSTAQFVDNYPGSSNLIESNIGEDTTGSNNTLSGFSVNAISTSDNNKFLGNISLNYPQGIRLRARGSTAATMPKETIVRDHVVANSRSLSGGYFAGVRNASTVTCQNCSFIAGAGNGFEVTVESSLPGDGNHVSSFVNVMTLNNVGIGARSLNQDTWSFNYVGAFGNGTNFSPAATDVNITNELTSNPNMGGCYTMVPAASPYKGTGFGGADVGADAMYRYVDGVKTALPMFLAGSDYQFYGCGATVTGVNDSAASSCLGVHQRLNLHAAASPRCTPPY